MTTNLYGAPRTLTLTNEEGEEISFNCSPLEARDHDELTYWVQDQCMEVAKRACKGADEGTRQSILRAAISESTGLTWTMGKGAAMVATPEGMCKVVHISIRKNHPNLTFEEVKRYIFNPRNASQKDIDRVTRNLERANQTISKANGFSKNGEDLPGKSRKKGKRRRGKRRK